MHADRRVSILAAMLQFVFAASVASAQTGTGTLAALPIDQLKRIYLACDLAASRQVLDMTSAAYCSSVGETLQQRAFDGSFDRLLTWWRTEKLHAVSASQASAQPKTCEGC